LICLNQDLVLNIMLLWENNAFGSLIRHPRKEICLMGKARQSIWKEWQKTILRLLAPDYLMGITFPDWCRLLMEIRFSITPSSWLKAGSITAFSILNSIVGTIEDRRYGDRIRKTETRDPVFIIGVARSGTTFLFNLLTRDRRFAFPNLYQASNPHTFLTTENAVAGGTSRFIPDKRAQDNVEQSWQTPAEDEQALAILSRCSSTLSTLFPNNRAYFARFRSFEMVSEEEIENLKNAYRYYLRKLSWKYNRPLILKSPLNICRIRLLREMFPKARFVHIVRNPYHLFQSAMHMNERINSLRALQKAKDQDLAQMLITRYREMMKSYLEQRSLIPEEYLHQVHFEDLEAEPLAEIRKLYQSLSFPHFSEAEGRLRAHLENISGYRRNLYEDLSPEIISQINESWGFWLDQFGYRRCD